MKMTGAEVLVCSPGFMYPGGGPGSGVGLDEKLAARFPDERAYLPVNRKLDGTVFNW